MLTNTSRLVIMPLHSSDISNSPIGYGLVAYSVMGLSQVFPLVGYR